MEKHRTLGWEIVDHVERERPTIRQRLVPDGAQIRAALLALGIFSVAFVIAAWLAANPFAGTQRLASPRITALGWEGTRHWKIFVPVVLLSTVFEFLDAAAGMGYGTAITPLLLVLGFVPKQIVPVVVIQQALVGLVGTFLHKEFKNVEWKLRPMSETVRLWLYLSVTGCFAAAFSITSVYALLKVATVWINLYVALLLILMGLASLLSVKSARPYRPRRLALFGGLAAFNKGIGGGGYGPVVTIGGMLSGVPVKSMMAVTALCEGTVCAFSVLIWVALAASGQPIDLILLPSMLLGSMAAAVLAPYFTRVFPERLWRWLVPSYSLVVAAYVSVKVVPQVIAALR